MAFFGLVLKFGMGLIRNFNETLGAEYLKVTDGGSMTKDFLVWCDVVRENAGGASVAYIDVS